MPKSFVLLQLCYNRTMASADLWVVEWFRRGVQFAFGVASMKSKLVVAVAGACVVLFCSNARADTVLLDLINPATQTNTPYDLSFVATGSTTTISIAGYQNPDFETSTDNGVFLNGSGSNLLGSTWTFTAAATGSLANTFSDGTSVLALNFGAGAGDLDTFSQTIATTPGDTYVIELLYSNNTAFNGSAPSEFRVSTTAATPLPAALPLFATGLGGLGLLGWRRRKAQAVT